MPGTDTDQHGLEEIVVTATRMERELRYVPGALSVVGQRDIQQGRQQLALDEVLNRVPGVLMQNRGSLAQGLRISLRGFGARSQFGIRGVKIIVDGIPETLPDGQGSTDSVDLGAVRQIEVIRGPSSTLYGNASGGVISIETERGTEQPFVDFRLTEGRYGFRKTQIKAGGSGERVDYFASLSGIELDGHREHSRFESTQLGGRIGVDLGAGRELLAVASFLDNPVSQGPGGLPADLAAGNPRAAWPASVAFDAGGTRELSRLGLAYGMPIGKRHEIALRSYHTRYDMDASLTFVSGGQVGLERRYAGSNFSYSYDGVWMNRPNRLIVGMDFDDQNDDRRRFDNHHGMRGALTFDQNERITSRGVFLQNVLSVSESMELTFGMRFDEMELDVTDHFLADGSDDSGAVSFEDTSPMAGVVVRVGDGISLYGTYSTAFETPTTTELNNPDASGGFNQRLQSQVARNLEVGLRGTAGERHRYEIALFDIDVHDELIPFEMPGRPGRNFYRNAGKSKRNGVELSWTANVTERIRSTLSYTYSSFEFEEFVDDAGNDFGGKAIPGTAENVIFGELTYAHPRGWFATGDVLYVDEQFADNANSAVIADYTLANLRLGYTAQLGDLRIEPFLGIKNALDEPYTANVSVNAFGGRFYEPGPGRNAYAGVSLRYGLR